MLWRTAIRLAALSSAVAIAGAQQVRPGVLGFVLDGSLSTVRPLWGAPGSAHIGDPMDLGGTVASFAASPKQDYVLALTGPSADAMLWMPGTSTVLSGVPAGATQVVLSPEGGSAVFYYAASNQIRVFSGLPTAPAPVFAGSLAAMMNPLNSLAVSDDGAMVLASEAAVSGNSAPSVDVFGVNGFVGRIALSGPASAIAFLSNSHDALLSSPSETVLIRDASAQTSRMELPASLNGSIGVIATADGSNALFAHSLSGLVSILSLSSSGAQPATLNCNCTPTGIARTAAKSIYRLGGSTGSPVSQPLSLIDVSASQPRMLVIPPLVITPDNQ